MQAELRRLGDDLKCVPEAQTAIKRLVAWGERRTCAGVVARWLSSVESQNGSSAGGEGGVPHPLSMSACEGSVPLTEAASVTLVCRAREETRDPISQDGAYQRTTQLRSAPPWRGASPLGACMADLPSGRHAVALMMLDLESDASSQRRGQSVVFAIAEQVEFGTLHARLRADAFEREDDDLHACCDLDDDLCDVTSFAEPGYPQTVLIRPDAALLLACNSAGSQDETRAMYGLLHRTTVLCECSASTPSTTTDLVAKAVASFSATEMRKIPVYSVYFAGAITSDSSEEPLLPDQLVSHIDAACSPTGVASTLRGVAVLLALDALGIRVDLPPFDSAADAWMRGVVGVEFAPDDAADADSEPSAKRSCVSDSTCPVFLVGERLVAYCSISPNPASHEVTGPICDGPEAYTCGPDAPEFADLAPERVFAPPAKACMVAHGGWSFLPTIEEVFDEHPYATLPIRCPPPLPSDEVDQILEVLRAVVHHCCSAPASEIELDVAPCKIAAKKRSDVPTSKTQSLSLPPHAKSLVRVCAALFDRDHRLDRIGFCVLLLSTRHELNTQETHVTSGHLFTSVENKCGETGEGRVRVEPVCMDAARRLILLRRVLVLVSDVNDEGDLPACAWSCAVRSMPPDQNLSPSSERALVGYFSK